MLSIVSPKHEGLSEATTHNVAQQYTWNREVGNIAYDEANIWYCQALLTTEFQNNRNHQVRILPVT